MCVFSSFSLVPRLSSANLSLSLAAPSNAQLLSINANLLCLASLSHTCSLHHLSLPLPVCVSLSFTHLLACLHHCMHWSSSNNTVTLSLPPSKSQAWHHRYKACVCLCSSQSHRQIVSHMHGPHTSTSVYVTHRLHLAPTAECISPTQLPWPPTSMIVGKTE